jgi:hypothetical protein
MDAAQVEKLAPEIEEVVADVGKVAVADDDVVAAVPVEELDFSGLLLDNLQNCVQQKPMLRRR